MNRYELVLGAFSEARGLARIAGRPAHDSAALRQAQQKPKAKRPAEPSLLDKWNALIRPAQPQPIRVTAGELS